MCLDSKCYAWLLAEVRKVADAQQTTIDELVRDAMERRLRNIRRQKLRAYGEAQARMRVAVTAPAKIY